MGSEAAGQAVVVRVVEQREIKACAGAPIEHVARRGAGHVLQVAEAVKGGGQHGQHQGIRQVERVVGLIGVNPAGSAYREDAPAFLFRHRVTLGQVSRRRVNADLG